MFCAKFRNYVWGKCSVSSAMCFLLVNRNMRGLVLFHVTVIVLATQNIREKGAAPAASEMIASQFKRTCRGDWGKMSHFSNF